ncbi:PilZ domain-containing protein [Desulfogranum mediterraneum]|uniref:PilZ domain-containing protein n=1 Tax=Desulfogranum mediterraneum TaxID=160661 RepID=UPI0009FDFCB0|nr:PilZ domain-containing protein [Desulfogranum mediterraneum]
MIADYSTPKLHPDKRQHTRVVFTRTVKIRSQNCLLGEFPARNLSMGGLFIQGCPRVQPKGYYQLELRESGRQSSLILRFYVKVARIEADGVAVEFIEMEDDSFMFLQTMVLYASDDPIGITEDFLEDFSTRCRSNRSGPDCE